MTREASSPGGGPSATPRSASPDSTVRKTPEDEAPSRTVTFSASAPSVVKNGAITSVTVVWCATTVRPTERMSCGSRIASIAPSDRATRSRAYGRYCRPAVDGRIRPRSRTNSWVPSVSSSWRSCRDRDGWATRTAAAARVTEPSSTTARK